MVARGWDYGGGKDLNVIVIMGRRGIVGGGDWVEVIVDVVDVEVKMKEVVVGVEENVGWGEWVEWVL